MLPALNLVISASTEAFARGLSEAEERVASFTQRASDGMKRAGDATTRMGKAMLPVSGVVAGAATAMGALALETVSVGNEIDKAARAAGVAVEPFQEIGFALGQITDLSQGEANNALATLNRRIGQAVDGNERYADALDKLGISLADVASGAVSTEDVFNALVDGIQDTSSAAEAATMASDLLGDRIGGRVGPALREFGGDVAGLRQQLQEMGGVLSAETVGAAADAADQMDRVNRQFRAARMTIGAAMLPILMRFGDLLEGTIIPGIQRFADGVGQAIEWFDALPEGVQQAAGIIGTALGAGGPVLIAIGGVLKFLGMLLALISPAGLLIAAIVGLAAAWVKWGDDVKAAVSGAVDWMRTKFEELMDWFRGLPEMFREFGANIIQGFTDGIRDRWEALKGGVSEVWSNVTDGAREFFRIRSPSQEFHEIGGHLMDGLALGIEDGAPRVVQAMRGVANDVIASARTMAGAVSGTTFGMVNDVLGAMGQLFQGNKAIAIAQAIVNIAQGITAALARGPLGFADVARIAAQGAQALAQIRSARPGGSSAAPSVGGAQAQAQAIPVQRMVIETQGGGMIPQSSLGGLIEQINEAGRQGYVIDAQFVGGGA